MYVPWTREIDVVCIILNFLVKLAAYPDIGVTMDIVVIDVPDRWGMCWVKLLLLNLPSI